MVAAQLKNPKRRPPTPEPQQTYVDDVATVPQSQASPATMPMPAVADPAFGRPGDSGQAAYAAQGQPGQYPGQVNQGQYGGQPPQSYGQGPVPGGPCPRCQTVNDPTRRFCSKCGYVLIADNTVGANIPLRPQQPRGWWARLTGDSHDRAARRAYRRSLPPLYRWRRVLIGLLVLATGIGGFSFFFHKSPLRWSLERWDDITGATIDVAPVKVRIDPQTATVQGSSADALIDKTVQSWTGIWPPGTPQGESCVGGASTWSIVIETARKTRIREVDITAGLDAADPNRALQARPKAIGIILDGDAANCRSWVLKDDAATQKLKLDSVTGVSEVRIVVNTTYAEPQDGQHVLSIREITLKSRPRR